MENNQILPELFIIKKINCIQLGIKCEKCFKNICFIVSKTIVFSHEDPVFQECVKLLMSMYNTHQCKTALHH